jgi:hypothetical protein
MFVTVRNVLASRTLSAKLRHDVPHLSLHQWQLYWSDVMVPSKISQRHSSITKLKGRNGNLSSARANSEFILWGTSSTEPWIRPKSWRCRGDAMDSATASPTASWKPVNKKLVSEIWGSNGRFCEFVAYLTTSSVARILRWLLNYKLKGMWKEMGVAEPEVLWGYVGTWWRHAGVTDMVLKT